MESGEGIERDELETTGKVVGKGPWNPVKELKVDDLWIYYRETPETVVESGEGIES